MMLGRLAPDLVPAYAVATLPDGEPKITGSTVVRRADLEEPFPGWVRLTQLAVVLGVIGAGLVLWGAFGGEGVDLRLTVGLPMTFMALLLLYFRYLQRKMARPSPVKAPLGEVVTTFVLDDSGFTVQSSLGSSRTPWSTLTGHRETNSSFLLFSGHEQYFVLPKRAFPEEDLPRMQELFRTYIQVRLDTTSRYRVLVAWTLVILAFGGISWFFRDTEPDRGHHGHGGTQRDGSNHTLPSASSPSGSSVLPQLFPR